MSEAETVWTKLWKRWSGRDEHPGMQELLNRLQSVESELKRLSDKRPDVRIHVEKLDVQQAVLESLTFRLDKLEIEELSGALNLGNNFGTAPEQSLLPEKRPQTSTKSSTAAEASPYAATRQQGESWERTATGYSYKADSPASRQVHPKDLNNG